MNTLVSILLPTRNPLPWLNRMLDSVKETARRMDEVEIILRVDDDDTDRLALIPALKEKYGAKAVVGPRGKGYFEMGTYIDECVAAATGKWCWLCDDDGWIAGDWQDQLAAIPCDAEAGPAVNAEWYKLGTSEYRNSGSGEPCGILLPREFVAGFPAVIPVDKNWLLAAKNKGWKFELLKNVAYCHDGRPR